MSDFGQHRGMVLVILILLVLAIVLGVALSAGRRTLPVAIMPEPQSEDLSPTELAERDPVEALLRYGTPDDVARLSEQGIDLGGLGYRTPKDE